MYKNDLVLNNLKWLIFHKTKSSSYFFYIFLKNLYRFIYAVFAIFLVDNLVL